MTPKHTFRDAAGDLWLKETLSGGLGNCFRVDTLLDHSESDLQDLILFENAEHGRVLAIDGLVQVSTKDEFVYHEMVSHVPILAHGAVKRVLIIGGGDGGAMREMLKHPGIESISLVEIDADVIEFSKRWFPEVSNGSFEDARVEIVITDGAAFVKTDQEPYDLILVDSSDPVGPSAVLFTPEFYADCRARLAPNGILVTQSGLVSIHPEPVTDTAAAFRDLFAHPAFYLICVPAFSGGFMALGFGTDNTDAMTVSEDTLRQRLSGLELNARYYAPEVHKAAFALPPFVQDVIAGKA